MVITSHIIIYTTKKQKITIGYLFNYVWQENLNKLYNI